MRFKNLKLYNNAFLFYKEKFLLECQGKNKQANNVMGQILLKILINSL